MSELITDRTAEETTAAAEIRMKYQKAGNWSGITGAEKNALGRTAYTYTDINRVESAVSALADALTRRGYPIQLTVKTDWKPGDMFTYSDAKRYLANVAAIRSTYPNTAAMPEAVTIDRWIDYIAANDIERILWETERAIEGADSIVRRCGTFRAGGSYTSQIIRRAT